MTLRIFDPAPDFSLESTAGPLRFHDWKAGRWAVLLSAPFAFTPVCTTELAALQRRKHEFDDRGVLLAVLAIDTVEVLAQWAQDVENMVGEPVGYPLLADAERTVAGRYGMLPEDRSGMLPVAPGRWMKRTAEISVRTLFVVSPGNRVSLTISYPPNVGLNFDEVLRTIDSLQLAKYKVATPADWVQGEDVVVGRVVADPVARARFGSLRQITHYLRFTTQPPWEIRRRPGA
jgi:thioredoxin-dependent peroxiredoxin